MEVQNFRVGPIVGEAKKGLVKIFGRGPGITAPNRTFGYSVCRFRALGGDWQLAPIRYQQPHFDFTGVSIIQHVDAGKTYEYQAGFVVSTQPIYDASQLNLNWRRIKINRFRTAKLAPQPTSLVFGSCRYLLRFMGGVCFDTRGDKTFESVASEDADMVFMIGDQIYADDMRNIAPDSSLDEFWARYRTVFSQPHFTNLVANTPTFMTLDDHEIEDNWPTHASSKDEAKFTAAMQAYKTYQMSHSPASVVNISKEKLLKVPNQYWYRYQNGCADFFVMDVRTERKNNDMISKEQTDELINFLTTSTHKIKVVVSSVPIAPDFNTDLPDKWSGFPQLRNKVLSTIKEDNIKNVVFLSGDVHAAMVNQITCDSDPNFKVLSVVSSPFFWPLLHGRPSHFTTEGVFEPEHGFRFNSLIDPICNENYARVDFSEEKIVVAIKQRNGKLYEEVEIRLD